MAFGDRRGPKGLGPMTGRGWGQCAVARTGGGFGGSYERGGAFGPGGGKGWRHWYRATGLQEWARAGRGGGRGAGMGTPAQGSFSCAWESEPWSETARDSGSREDIAFLIQEAKPLAEELGRIQQRIEEIERK